MKITISIATVLLSLLHFSLIAQGPINSSSSTHCPMMVLEISPAINNNQYRVSYCNLGNSVADNAYLILKVDDNKTLKQATKPYYLLPDGSYKFDLGNMQADQCEEFSIQFHYSYKNYCFNGKIFPDVPCQEMIDSYISTYINVTGTTTGGGNSGSNPNNYFNQVAGRQQLPNSFPGLGSNSIFEDNVILINVPDSMFMNGNSTALTSSNSNSANSTRIFDLSSIVSIDICNGESGTASGNNTVSDSNSINNSPNNRPVISSTNSSVSLESTVSTPQIRVYPNPFQHFTTIELDQATDNMQVQLRNMNGQLVLNKSIPQQKSIRINRNNLVQAVYILQIINEKEIIYTQKLIVR